MRRGPTAKCFPSFIYLGFISKFTSEIICSHFINNFVNLSLLWDFIFAPLSQLSGRACLCFHWSPRSDTLMVRHESCLCSLLVSTHAIIWIRQTFVCHGRSGHPAPDAGCQSSPCVSADLWPLLHLIITTLLQEWNVSQHMVWLLKRWCRFSLSAAC